MKNLPIHTRSDRLDIARKVASERVTKMPLNFETVTIFLNRNCPRTCVQCGIADNSRTWMSTEEWIQAFDNLNKVFGATFYLFLGTEPLIMGQGLIDIIKWMKERGLFYGFYSTSPEPLFSKWKERLVDAGLDNWSSGIDMLPHLGELDPITMKKVKESIIGLQWMAERGISTHTSTTIHKQNYKVVPQIVEWIQDNVPGIQCTINFIEWRKEPKFDFFAPPEDMKHLLWDGSDEERADVQKMLLEVLAMSRVEGRLIQCTDHYLTTGHLHYDKLDEHCAGVIGPSVDSDGTMRLCGYNRGEKVMEYNVLNIDLTPELFLKDWNTDLWDCSGCHWAFPSMLSGDTRILDPASGFHQDRWSLKHTKQIPLLP